MTNLQGAGHEATPDRVLRRRVAAATLTVLLLATTSPPAPVLANHFAGHPVGDQGLNASEEKVFTKALRLLLTNPDVDLVITMRRAKKPQAGCRKRGTVYWVYAARGTICFTRRVSGRAWKFDVQIVKGKNPISRQSATVLKTLAEERAASSITADAEPRNLIRSSAITYPYAYERIVAELDSPRAGDFMIVPANTADRGGPGAHGHPGLPQSRTTLILSGRGARRSPLSRKAEAKLKIKNVDVAPTVARALGVNPYFADTGEVARLLNGTPSETALLERQDGRVLNQLIEPVYNTFVVVIDGLRPEDVTPTLMPNLTSLLSDECAPGGVCAAEYETARAIMVTETNSNHVAMMTGAYAAKSGMVANDTLDRKTGEQISLDRPELNLAETLFDAIERQKPWLSTAAVFGKDKLRDLFDCTTNESGECASSAANPESREVKHVRPDFLGGAHSSPADPETDCPSEPGTGSGYSKNDCTMDVALGLLGRDDPDLTFINLPEVDAFFICSARAACPLNRRSRALTSSSAGWSTNCVRRVAGSARRSSSPRTTTSATPRPPGTPCAWTRLSRVQGPARSRSFPTEAARPFTSTISRASAVRSPPTSRQRSSSSVKRHWPQKA